MSGGIQLRLPITTTPVCNKMDTEFEPGAYNVVRHVDPPNEKVLDNLHGSALYCGGNDRSLSSAGRTRSGTARVVEDTSDFG